MTGKYVKMDLLVMENLFHDYHVDKVCPFDSHFV